MMIVLPYKQSKGVHNLWAPVFILRTKAFSILLSAFLYIEREKSEHSFKNHYIAKGQGYL